ncbi:MAG: hypothetical protein ACLTDS_06440 [Bianqueaceae bacterium]
MTTAQVYLAVAQALAADTVATTMTVGDQDVTSMLRMSGPHLLPARI